MTDINNGEKGIILTSERGINVDFEGLILAARKAVVLIDEKARTDSSLKWWNADWDVDREPLTCSKIFRTSLGLNPEAVRVTWDESESFALNILPFGNPIIVEPFIDGKHETILLAYFPLKSVGKYALETEISLSRQGNSEDKSQFTQVKLLYRLFERDRAQVKFTETPKGYSIEKIPGKYPLMVDNSKISLSIKVMEDKIILEQTDSSLPKDQQLIHGPHSIHIK
jgi:hypothetical protein